jgi:hypothetical protein
MCLCVMHEDNSNFTSLQYFLVKCKVDKFRVHRFYVDTETAATLSVIYTYEVPGVGQL